MTHTERVADSLVAYILEEGIKAGDPLPATAELAERYGVSRTVVREAIADLSGRGILSRGQGRETIVQSPGQEQLGSLLLFRTLSDGVAIEEVQETRRAIETVTVALAAQRRTPEDLMVLGRTLDDMTNATTDAERNDADHTFHRALARASQNRLLAIVYEGINALIREIHVRATAGRLVRGETLESVIAAHRLIYDAVARGDEQGARDAMVTHLRDVEARLAVFQATEAK